MERFTRLTAIACPLGLANVDTDQLIPARFMKRSRSEGYGGFLMHDLRFADDGSALRDFVLADPGFAEAKILVAGRNFGTGSSREAAVYALWDYGIRCVIAESFGDIFAGNAVKNGLLLAEVSETHVNALLAGLATNPVLSVDLDALRIEQAGTLFPFSIDSVRRLQLLNGWDDIDLTRRHRDNIVRYRQSRVATQPWSMPRVIGISERVKKGQSNI